MSVKSYTLSIRLTPDDERDLRRWALQDPELATATADRGRGAVIRRLIREERERERKREFEREYARQRNGAG